MKKSAFVKKVLKQAPTLSEVEGYFYVAPVAHILSGLFCEFTRDGIYIWRYAHPLFAKNSINLNFAERLPSPQGYIDFGQINRADLVAEFCYRLSKAEYQSGLKPTTLKDLEKFISNTPRMLINPNIHRIYAYLNILLENFSKSKSELDSLVDNLYKSNQGQSCPIDFSQEEVAELKRMLEVNPRDAKKRLLSWVDETKKHLNL